MTAARRRLREAEARIVQLLTERDMSETEAMILLAASEGVVA
jgi:hypothetical protein